MILAFDGVIDVNVSGVSIPGNDGRAGLAALVVRDGFDLDGLKRHLDASLPTYARPLFLQIRQSLEVTETFKHTRQTPALERLDPASSDYRLYVASRSDNRYVPVDPDMHREFTSGAFRF
jgi:fatty-acyl-CoA synthase